MDSYIMHLAFLGGWLPVTNFKVIKPLEGA